MKVYHGSYTAIDEIDLEKCQWGKDFGRGFYVTTLRNQAEIWAKRMGRKQGDDGVVTEFEFKEHICRFNKMKILRFDGYTEDWLDFIILNRTNEIEQQIHDYDIVEGNVANDEVTARVFDYQNGLISKETLLEELEYKVPNHQLCFCTMQSLQALIPAKNDIDISIIHIDNKIIASFMSDYHNNEMEATAMYYKSQTYSQLSDPITGLYKKDWTKIYEMLKKELKQLIPSTCTSTKPTSS
jgi:hypothetical protein